MPKADPAHIIPAAPLTGPQATPRGRRALFSALAGAALAGAAAPAVAARAARQAHPDAELARLCDELTALTAEIETYYEGPLAIEDDDERDEELAPLRARERALTRHIASLPAATASGLRAKARAYVTWHPDFDSNAVAEGYADELLRASIIHDATRL